MARKGRPTKEFHEYLIEPSNSHILHDDYMRSPATAFLSYAVDAKDAIHNCHKYFKMNKNHQYNRQSLSSLQHISAALLPTIMGHFETYQKYLFAGVFEYSIFFKQFNLKTAFNKLDALCKFSIDPIRVSGYRGISTQVGLLLADNLKDWHNPKKVNQYFQEFFSFRQQMFGNDDIRRLNTLWQLRHSIVHTGCTITFPDAQKNNDLANFGNKAIVFDTNFIIQVSRKMHPIVRDATRRTEANFREKIKDDINPEELSKIEDLFKVDSKVKAWLNE
jgi:hypothetical protein